MRHKRRHGLRQRLLRSDSVREQVLPMNTGVEGGETAIKLARYDLLCCTILPVPLEDNMHICAHTRLSIV